MGLAATKGHTQTVECLAALGVAIDDVDGEGYTPLARATAAAHAESVGWFVERGADIRAKSAQGLSVRGVCEARVAAAQTRTELSELQRIILLLGKPTAAQSTTTLM